MTVQAFVDESRRGRSYLVCAVVVEAEDLARSRASLRGMLLSGPAPATFRQRKVTDVVSRSWQELPNSQFEFGSTYQEKRNHWRENAASMRCCRIWMLSMESGSSSSGGKSARMLKRNPRLPRRSALD